MLIVGQMFPHGRGQFNKNACLHYLVILLALIICNHTNANLFENSGNWDRLDSNPLSDNDVAFQDAQNSGFVYSPQVPIVHPVSTFQYPPYAPAAYQSPSLQASWQQPLYRLESAFQQRWPQQGIMGTAPLYNIPLGQGYPIINNLNRQPIPPQTFRPPMHPTAYPQTYPYTYQQPLYNPAPLLQAYLPHVNPRHLSQIPPYSRVPPYFQTPSFDPQLPNIARFPPAINPYHQMAHPQQTFHPRQPRLLQGMGVFPQIYAPFTKFPQFPLTPKFSVNEHLISPPKVKRTEIPPARKAGTNTNPLLTPRRQIKSPKNHDQAKAPKAIPLKKQPPVKQATPISEEVIDEKLMKNDEKRSGLNPSIKEVTHNPRLGNKKNVI